MKGRSLADLHLDEEGVLALENLLLKKESGVSRKLRAAFFFP